MGDFEVQDWMELAVSDDQDLAQVRVRKVDQFEDELDILAGHLPPANALSTAAHSSDEEPDHPPHKKHHQRKLDSSFTEQVDPAKVADELMLVELFQGLPQVVGQTKPMTQPRQFEIQASSLSEKLLECRPSETVIEQFAEELLLSIYGGLSSDGIQSLCEKFKVLRYDKKQEDKKHKKKTARQQRTKHNEHPATADQFM